MTDVVIGIDPGLSGGVAVLTLDGEVVYAGTMPVIKTGKSTEVDGSRLTEFLTGFVVNQTVKLAALERVGARPGQGVCSMFNFGVSYGIVRGVIASLGIPLELPTPQAWQKLVFAGSPVSPVKGNGKATKLMSVAYCTRRFPTLSLKATLRSRVDHDGMSDAVCLAEYARRLVVGR